MADVPPLSADLAALAAEACDLWQAQIEACAQDPATRAELLRMAEPSQRLFAGWASMMHSAAHAGTAAPSASSASAAAPRSAAAEPASDGGALRLAQLAHRLGELEKRVAELETASAAHRPGARKG